MSSVARTLDETAFFTEATNKVSLISMSSHPNGPTAKLSDLKRWNGIQPDTRGNPNSLQGPFTGLLTVSENAKVNHLFLPRHCADGEEKPYLIGTASNNARNPVPRLLPTAALRNFFGIFPKSMAPTGCIGGDIPLDLTDVRVLALITEDMKQDFPADEELFVYRVPVSLPIPGGHEAVYKGGAEDQAITDQLHNWYGDAGPNWLSAVLHWTEEQHNALLTEELAKYLPKGRGNNEALYTSPFISHQLGGIDEDEDLMHATEQLLAECESKAAAMTEVAVPQIGRTVPLNAPQDGDLDTIMGDIPKIDKVQRMQNELRGKLLLLGANRKKGAIIPTALGKLSALLLKSTTKTECTSTVRSGMLTAKGEFQNSVHFLCRKADPPKPQAVVDAFMGTLTLDTTKRESLTDKNAQGLSFLHFLPDTKASSEAKGKDSHKYVAEDALDEATEKRTKLNTDYIPVESVTSLNDVEVCIANAFLFFATLYAVDPEATYSTEKWPIFCDWMMDTAKLLSGSDSKEWMKEYRGSTKEVKLAYYVLSSLTTLHTRVAIFVSDVVNQAKALSDEFEDIPPNLIMKAQKFFDNMIEQIEGVFEGSFPVPDSILWENSGDKQKEERAKLMILRSQLDIKRQAATPSAHTPPPASTVTPGSNRARGRNRTAGAPVEQATTRPKLHNDPATLGADGLDGYIIVPHGKHFSVPSELNGPRPGTEFALCKAHYMKGKKCKHGQSCNRSHAAPKDLPADKRKLLWTTMAGNTDGLSWNEELVNVEEMRKLSLA